MSLLKRLKSIVVGESKDPQDQHIFHRITLIAFFAWVGLGADGLSSSCYGPEEAFKALGDHRYLSIFVAILSAVTVFLISASYSQIIKLFPTGGGGYLVASKLLNPTLGMISGCALIIDYVLTIAISIASGADAIFSFLPSSWLGYKLIIAGLGVIGLLLMNLRGVKESVLILTPIFLVFLATHLVAIVYSVIVKLGYIPQVIHSSMSDIGAANAELGLFGLIFIILRAYALGAGTFTGIEAVSNGLPILRDPKVETGKKTMRYMALSLAFTVFGLMIAYLLFNVAHQEGKTLNAVLFEAIVQTWASPWGQAFVLVSLISEAMLLVVAAQAGFVDGPRVLANMAVDRWMPSRFSNLSDRLVTQNGILVMGLAALLTLFVTRGSVHLLVVLYSINVFITFCLSQAGMVRHWWQVRREEKKWKKNIFINGIGLSLTSFILIFVVILKFQEGGWVTLLVTGWAVVLAILIKKHYKNTLIMLKRLNSLLISVTESRTTSVNIKPDPGSKTAAILVNGFNGLGLHTVMGVIKNFGKEFKNFVFIEIGVIDAGNFKGTEGISNLKSSVNRDLDRYVQFMNHSGYYAQKFSSFGIEVVEEAEKMAENVNKQFPGIVFFGGQLIFEKDTWINRLLHNYTVFAIQKRLYQKGMPFMILPIRV